MSMRELTIRGMHCQGCVGRIGEALRGMAGVHGAEVTLHPARARVNADADVSTEALVRAVRSAGAYEAEPVPETAADEVAGQSVEAEAVEAPKSLRPLVIVVAYILGVAGVATWARGDGSAHALMNDFMAGFFIVFSFFKMLDLAGFVSAYRMYDLPARAFKPWAYMYPFVELGLGVAYLTRWQPVAANVVTLVLMLVGAAGVLNALRQKQTIRCACLGTALNLPMTTVTLVEDLLMAGMAAAMLLWR